MEMQSGQGTPGNNLIVSYKAKHIPYDPAILLPGICPTEMKPYVHTKSCT